MKSELRGNSEVSVGVGVWYGSKIVADREESG